MRIQEAWAELELTPGANEAEVKSAWRRMASRWHPDRNDSPDAVARMQRVNEAFELLQRLASGELPPEAPPTPQERKQERRAAREAERARAASDRAGSSARPDPQDSTGRKPFGDEPGETEPPEDAPGAGRRNKRRGVHRRVNLTLEQAALGCIQVIKGRVIDDCHACHGLGYLASDGPCKRCEGSGQVRQRAWYGWINSVHDCEACAGTGRSRQPCLSCGGVGSLGPRKFRVSVRIPPGVRTGDWLHVPEPPAPGQVASARNIDLRIHVLPHPFFELGDDGTLRCEMPVHGLAWVTQRWIEVPTPAGVHHMHLIRDRLIYRLRGQGFPQERRGERADLLIHIRPVFPTDYNAEQGAWLDQLIAGTTPAQAASGAPQGQAQTEGGEHELQALARWARQMAQWQAEPAHQGGPSGSKVGGGTGA